VLLEIHACNSFAAVIAAILTSGGP